MQVNYYSGNRVIVLMIKCRDFCRCAISMSCSSSVFMFCFCLFIFIKKKQQDNRKMNTSFLDIAL